MIRTSIKEIKVSRETERFKTISMIIAMDLISVTHANRYKTSINQSTFQMFKIPI